MTQVQYSGTGRRKTSTARVRLVLGTGRIVINDREAADYFPYDTQLIIVNQPLVATETTGTYDISVNVHSGGFISQTVTIRQDTSHDLLKADPEYSTSLTR